MVVGWVVVVVEEAEKQLRWDLLVRPEQVEWECEVLQRWPPVLPFFAVVFETERSFPFAVLARAGPPLVDDDGVPDVLSCEIDGWRRYWTRERRPGTSRSRRGKRLRRSDGSRGDR